MADVAAPAGLNADALDAIPSRNYGYLTGPEDKPDIIVLMSESFWDPTRSEKPLASAPIRCRTIRAAQSGYVFSPEFGGMTANVEFEALTGFSNAFLPYGSIPYQQYVRSDDALACHLLPRRRLYRPRPAPLPAAGSGTATPVYKDFGFEEFQTEENDAADGKARHLRLR